VKTTWHIPKPMASLSRSLAPPTPKPSRPVSPIDDEPLAASRATTNAPPPMRRHAQGILGVLAARLPLFVWSTDSAMRVTSSLGVRPDNLPLPEAQGPKPELRLSDRLQPAEEEHQALTAHRTALRGEAVEFDVQGDGRTFEVHVEPLRDTAGAIEGTVGVAFDVTERRRAGTRLVHAVLHDPLTGLPNRTLFLERLRQALGRAQQRGPSRVAILLFDLDGFRAVNHQLGHDAGDRFLVDVSRRIEERLRSADTLARLEGDTFAVILQDVEQQADALRVARRIRENLLRPFVVAGFPRPATASVGIAVSEDARARVEDVLHDAEAALRRAREAGATGEHVFDPVSDIEPAAAWPRLGAPAPAVQVPKSPPASEAVLRWRPPAGQGTSRLRRLARAAGLVLPSRF
jgi:diguanylate cyclase (GGDEF)-like protein